MPRPLWFLGLAACPSTPTTPNTTPPPVEFQLGAPSITDGETTVGVVASLRLGFAGSLDPTSLDNVALTEVAYGVDLSLDVLVDEAASEIVLDPIRPLEHGHSYRFTVRGVAGLDGVVADDVEVSFSTAYNVRVRWDWLDFNNGTLSWAVLDGHDAQGRSVRSVRVEGSDEVRSSLSSWVYDDAAGVRTGATYAGPGDDGTWETDDDVVSRRTVATYDDRGFIDRSTTFVGDADVPHHATIYVADEAGRFAWFAVVSEPGPDSVWDTEDDVWRQWAEQTYGPGGLERLVTYTDPGEDSVWQSADDVPGHYRRYDHTAERVLDWSMAGPGPDALWFTEDDEISSLLVQDLDAQGLIARGRRYAVPGDDGIWNTGDDPLNHDETFTRDADGNLTRSERVNGQGARFEEKIYVVF